MKLYSRKLKRTVERQIHFGVGQSVETACGVVLPSRHVMVSIHSGFDGAIITDDMKRVTCKRCLRTSEMRIRKLVAIETSCPGVLDRPAICGKEWILAHSLDVKQTAIDNQKLQVESGTRQITLTNQMKPQDRKYILKTL